MNKVKNISSSQKKKIKNCIIIFIVYLSFFFFVESLDFNYHYLHHPLDDLIPFSEWALIPYASWFIYIVFALFYFLFNKEDDFYIYVAIVFGGMALCTSFNIFYPTAVALRPAELDGSGLLISMVRFLQDIDDPGNVCPSMHVYAALVTHLCLMGWIGLRKNLKARLLSFFLFVSISLSTLFLKQHSVIDVFWGAVVGLVSYLIVSYFKRASKNN